MPSDQDGMGAGDGSGLRGKRVLLAEDEGLVQLQLRRLLTHAGAILVGAARSGPEAVEMAQRTRPELVLLDINMPGEYNGLEAARRILALHRTCVVMLTGYSDELLKGQAREIGVCAYVVKPVTLNMVMPALEAALRDYEATRCG